MTYWNDSSFETKFSDENEPPGSDIVVNRRQNSASVRAVGAVRVSCPLAAEARARVAKQVSAMRRGWSGVAVRMVSAGSGMLRWTMRRGKGFPGKKKRGIPEDAAPFSRPGR